MPVRGKSVRTEIRERGGSVAANLEPFWQVRRELVLVLSNE
jgi:hypothetical protein